MKNSLYFYSISNIRVIDGDTIDADIDLGFSIFIRRRIRLEGIDAPETRLQSKISDPEERKKEKLSGIKSKDFLYSICESNKIYLISNKLDKYGRVLGEIFLIEDDLGVEESYTSINQLMISKGYASAYGK